LLDKLLKLPLFKQRSSEFSFDLRSLVIDGGNFEWREASSGGERLWQLSNGRIELQRVRGQQLRQYFQSFLKTEQRDFPGLGLRFDLTTFVLNGGAKINVRSRGYVVLPRETLDIRQARWNADLEVVDLPAALVKDLLAAGMPVPARSAGMLPSACISKAIRCSNFVFGAMFNSSSSRSTRLRFSQARSSAPRDE
jgi:hypothetical protein